MCFGSAPAPQAPTIVYRGPSQEDIDANARALQQYQTQMQQQQSAFQSSLQQQIDAANRDTAAMRAQYASELESVRKQGESLTAAAKGKAASDIASAGAAGAAQQVGAYAVSATQTATAEGAQTTVPISKKEKPKSTLKINTGGVASEAGAGLNIGV